MIISGNLDEVSVVDAFQLIGSSRKTGLLRASQKDGEIRIYWKSGSIVYAESQRAAPGLAERLRGQLDGARLDAALARHAGALGLACGELVAEGLLQAQELGALAEQSSREAVEELFSWTDGGFEFTEGPFPEGDIVPVELHTPSLIVEGSRRVQRAAQLAHFLPDRKTVFRLASLPDASLSSIRLGSEEWSMLSLVNGHRPVNEILRMSGGDEARVLQALYGLLSAGLIVELEPADEDDSGKLELGRVKYSRMLEVYCELHAMLFDRLQEGAGSSALPPLSMACAKLAKSYPGVWAGVPLEPERDLPGAQFLANILKVPTDQRTVMMMQAFGHLLLKEILVIRHLLGDDEARAAVTDVRMVVQLGARRYPEVSSKVLRHLRDVLRQAEQIPSRYKMGFDFFESHRYDEAIRLWRSIPPTNPQYSSAQELITQARSLTAGRSKLRLALERGENLYAEGRYEEAVRVWKEAVEDPAAAEDPEHETTKKTLLKRLDEMGRVSVLVGEARSRVADRRYDEARRLLEEALSIVPDLDEATELLKEIAERADKQATLRELVFQGLEQYRAERYPEAIETFRRVLALDLRHQLAGDHLRFSKERLAALVQSEPRYAAAVAASRAGDHVQAVELLEALLEQAPGDSIGAYFLREERGALQAHRLYHEARTFYLDRNYARATELLERCLEEFPDHAEARALRDQARARVASLDKARGLLEEAEQHFQAGALPAAQKAVDELLELDPQHRQARLARAQLQQALKEEGSAGTVRPSALVSRFAEERPTSSVRLLPEGTSPQIIEELLADAANGGGDVAPPPVAGRPPVPLRRDAAPPAASSSGSGGDEPTPDLREVALEVQKRLLDAFPDEDGDAAGS